VERYRERLKREKLRDCTQVPLLGTAGKRSFEIKRVNLKVTLMREGTREEGKHFSG